MTPDDIRAMAERLDPEPRRNSKNWEAWSDRECNRSFTLSALPSSGAQSGVLLDLFDLVYAPKGWRLTLDQYTDGAWLVLVRPGAGPQQGFNGPTLTHALYTAMKEIEGHD